MQGGVFCVFISLGLQVNILFILMVCEVGGVLLVMDNIYGFVCSFLINILLCFGVQICFVVLDIGVEIGDYMDIDVQVVLLESLGLLIMELQDLLIIVCIVQDKGIISIIDDIWSVGLMLKLLKFGIDLVVQVLIKYVGGYFDVMLGVVVVCMDVFVDWLCVMECVMGFYVVFDDVYLVVCGLWILEFCI